MDQPKMSRRARRQAEKIELEKKRAIARLQVERRKLDVTKEIDAYSTELADQAEARKHSRTAAARARLLGAIRAFGARVADDRPLLAATLMAFMCLVVAFVGQVMFYSSLSWPPVFLFMVVVLPVIVEGATWTFAINAEYLASKRLPYAADTRKMWMFATAAAGMNGYHGAVTLHEPITGVILGAASLVGPYIWHRYVTLKKVAKSGRTAEQIRAALLRRVFHPILWKRASDLWATADGALSSNMAWRIVWMRAKGAAPGMAPRLQVAPARNSWLFRLLFGRVVNPAIVVTRVATAAQGDAPIPPLQPVDIPTMGGAEQPALEGAAITDEEIATFLEAWTATPQQTETRSSGEVAQPAEQPVKAASNPRPQQPQQRGATTAADRVVQYFREQVAANVKPEDVSATAAARVAGCSRQAADKVLKRLRRESNQGEWK